jgi:hypothetical protein
MGLNPFATVSDYPSMLNKITLYTFFVSTLLLWLIYWQIPGFRQWIPPLQFKIPETDIQAPASVVILAFAFAFISRLALATGFGPTNPVPPSGTAVPGDKTYSASVIPTVTINNVSATVYGAALASGFAGLYQVAIQVPPTLTDGDWPIVANVAGVPSPAGIIPSVHH